MSKFVYSENELTFSETQCGMCVYNDPNNQTSCMKYMEKPEGVLEGTTWCPCLCTSNIFDT